MGIPYYVVPTNSPVQQQQAAVEPERVKPQNEIPGDMKIVDIFGLKLGIRYNMAQCNYAG
ncbi:hypothetical protein BZA05DRAFT_442756 [Tricharina praecox]|uniref:uncharacterized protein n=1 Tax=Tricharina praecox TaxID=43433 RepID=UPI00221F8BCF|nr:uncharacterized protein BZA05DRAFT_442756 [Tricharina praecox]KAI5856099.1 hypothetical protein BZA05DRAFT_442756 [Tricharina praecox]